MTSISKESKNWLMFFCFGDVSPINFSEWLYDCNEVEEAMERKDYLELIEKNFYKSREAYEAKDIVRNFCEDIGFDLDREYTINVLERMLNEHLPLAKGCEILSGFYDYGEGSNIIPIEIVGFYSELDTPENEARWLNFYRDSILKACRKLLTTLKDS